MEPDERGRCSSRGGPRRRPFRALACRTTLVAVVRLEQQAARAQESSSLMSGGSVAATCRSEPTPGCRRRLHCFAAGARPCRRSAPRGHCRRPFRSRPPPIPLEGQRAREVALARADVDDDVAARLARDAVAQLGEAHDLVHLLRLDRRPQRRRHVPLLRAPSVRVGARAWRRRAGAALRRRLAARVELAGQPRRVRGSDEARSESGQLAASPTSGRCKSAASAPNRPRARRSACADDGSDPLRRRSPSRGRAEQLRDVAAEKATTSVARWRAAASSG